MENCFNPWPSDVSPFDEPKFEQPTEIKGIALRENGTQFEVSAFKLEDLQHMADYYGAISLSTEHGNYQLIDGEWVFTLF